MRWLVALVFATATATAHADPEDSAAPCGGSGWCGAVAAALGAGAQGNATYGALELRLDAGWRDARLGLGGRAVWLDGSFRGRDWRRPIDAIRAIRLVELATAHLALAAGGLAPAQLGHVADGYRAALDDLPRTGVRAALTTDPLAIRAELDDVIDPAFAGGTVAWQATRRWNVQVATAIDPELGESAIELATARRWQSDDRAPAARIDVGGGLVVEPGLGGAGVGFVDAALERGGVRWTGHAELRAGTGTVGAAFGPLHLIERRALYDHARRGVGAAVSTAVAGRVGWLGLGARARPGRATLVTFAAGAPAGKYVQAGAWVAATRDHVAGAVELRIAWARRLASAVELARMYDRDQMAPAPAWSAIAWFAVATE